MRPLLAALALLVAGCATPAEQGAQVSDTPSNSLPATVETSRCDLTTWNYHSDAADGYQFAYPWEWRRAAAPSGFDVDILVTPDEPPSGVTFQENVNVIVTSAAGLTRDADEYAAALIEEVREYVTDFALNTTDSRSVQGVPIVSISYEGRQGTRTLSWEQRVILLTDADITLTHTRLAATPLSKDASCILASFKPTEG